jgi:hypothetical protein
MSIRSNDSKNVSMILREIMRNEGWRALYQGMSSSVIGIVVYKGTSFFFFEQFKHIYKKYSEKSHYVHGLAGSSASILGQILGYPFEVLKRRLMVMERKNLAFFKKQY